MVETVIWADPAGFPHRFEILAPGNSPVAAPGVYIFARLDGQVWYAVYIGQTDDMAVRLTGNHERADCIRQNGATHLHLMRVNGGEDQRREIEAALIQRWQPVCNRQGLFP